MKGEYIYKNKSDSVRIKIFVRCNLREWDVDVWTRDNGEVRTYSSEVGDLFATKREAKQIMTEAYGPLAAINPATVTEGW